MEQHTVIELDMQKIAKQNLWATILCTSLLIFINIGIQGHYTATFQLVDLFYFTLLYLVLIVLHEAFHLIGFMLFGHVPYRDLDYGVNLKLGVAYATTSKPLRNGAMKKALLLPFWTTGVVPALAGFYSDNYLLLISGAFLIAAAVGDIAMYRQLRAFPKNALVKDDPKLPRLYVYAEDRT